MEVGRHPEWRNTTSAYSNLNPTPDPDARDEQKKNGFRLTESASILRVSRGEAGSGSPTYPKTSKARCAQCQLGEGLVKFDWSRWAMWRSTTRNSFLPHQSVIIRRCRKACLAWAKDNSRPVAEVLNDRMIGQFQQLTYLCGQPAHGRRLCRRRHHHGWG